MLRLDPVPQVWGITGNLGGGKTLTAVCLASVAMSRGYYVVSNVSLNLDALALEYGPRVRKLYTRFSFTDPNFDPFKLPCGSPRGTPGGKRVLVILDECAEWIDQYAPAQDLRIKNFKSWLRHSSKRSQDVILIVQRLDYLQKDFRIIISKWVIVDDLRIWRVPVLKATIPFMGGYIMQRVFDRNKKLIQGPCVVRKRTFGRFYNTAECLNEQGAQSCYEYVPPRVDDIPFFRFVALWLASVIFLAYAVVRFSAAVELAASPDLLAKRAERASRQTKDGVAGQSTIAQPNPKPAEPASGDLLHGFTLF